MQQRPNNYFDSKNRQRKSILLRFFPWALIFIALAFLAIFGIKTLRDNKVAAEIKPYEDIFAENIIVDGLNISRMTPQDAYQALYQLQENRINSWSLDISYKGHTYVTINYQTLGLSTNTDAISHTLKKAWDLTHQGSPYQKKEAMDVLKIKPFETSTVQKSEFNDQKLEQILISIADNINSLSQVRDAKLIQFSPDSVDPFIIQKEEIGYQLDIPQAKENILTFASNGTSGSYDLTPQQIMPTITEAMLRKNLVLRSIAQTEISTSSEPNRTENIRVSARKINGLVLKPGQEFSFNKVAQERTLENGYYPALEQVYGYLETGVGGGVCQTSSTIYQAALLSDLAIVRRLPHGEPVRYTDAGLDATVYLTRDRELDFKFKNSTNNNLYIAARVRSGSSSRHLITEIRIYGEPFEDGAQYRLKTIETEKIYPPAEPLYVNDSKGLYALYKDEEVQKSASKEGSVVETYLQKYIDGLLVEEKFVSKSKYPSRQEQVWRGIKNRPSF
ncbi:MAG: hypothetical protein GX781_06620 [Clostridiales bacterium]|nr:hypothetical protein [Clostridiales bacterium]